MTDIYTVKLKWWSRHWWKIWGHRNNYTQL